MASRDQELEVSKSVPFSAVSKQCKSAWFTVSYSVHPAQVMHKDTRWSLHGKTALVTGGTKGIGLAIVEELAGLGAVVHTCSRNESHLMECINDWHEKGFDVSGSVCDVSSRVQRQKLLESVADVFDGKLNILVNNVGTNPRKPTLDVAAEDFSFTVSTNLESAYNICQLAYPLLKASEEASIVFISSVAGVVSVNTGSIYAVTKGGINQLTKSLACEWAKDDIRTNCVAHFCYMFFK